MGINYWKERLGNAVSQLAGTKPQRERLRNAYHDDIIYLEQEIDDLPDELQQEYKSLMEKLGNLNELSDDEVDAAIEKVISLYGSVQGL